MVRATQPHAKATATSFDVTAYSFVELQEIKRTVDAELSARKADEMETLRTVVKSMQKAAANAGVKLVTGDTKVVDKGKGDGIFINTSGIGVIQEIPGLATAARPGAPPAGHVEKSGVPHVSPPLRDVGTTAPAIGPASRTRSINASTDAGDERSTGSIGDPAR